MKLLFVLFIAVIGYGIFVYINIKKARYPD